MDMRTLIVFNITSLDGYSAGVGGDVMVMPMDAAFNAYNAERMRAASTVLLGASSFLGFQSYWPAVKDDPSADEDNRQFSRLYDPIAKAVVSDTIDPDGIGPWQATTEVIRRADAHARIAELKASGDGEIVTWGSGTLWNDLLGAGLVDEVHLMVGPVVLGGGTPAFRGSHRLRFLGARTFSGSENVLLRYAPSSR
jgi:dihydrofolate reductase